MLEKELIESLNKAPIEKLVRLQPVNYKYLRWDQISKYIIPVYEDFSDMNENDAQKIIKQYIADNELSRIIITEDRSVYVKKMVEEPIRVYTLTEEEMEGVCWKMAESALAQSVYNRVLFDCCLFRIDKHLIFFCLLNHLITDGQINIKNSNNKFIYADFERYISGLVGEELVRFDIYIKLKKSLIDLYFSEEMEYYHFFIEDEKRIFYKLLTLEEFWTISICELLRSTISQINQVPINITSGGRKFENCTIEALGDFHEDYIFVIDNYAKFTESFAYYRKHEYLNAEQYENYLKRDDEYSQYIEPITLSVKWKNDNYNEFQRIRKKFPKHEKNAVLGFNILVSKNLKSVQIDIRASKKLHFLFEDFENKIKSCIKWTREGNFINE